MRTKKILIWLPAIALAFTANVALADHFSDKAEQFYNRFCTRNSTSSLFAFMCDLRERVDNIELLPGPVGGTGATGLQGPQGGTGAVGPQGLPGAGQTLKIFDANGAELGILLDQNTFYYEPIDKLVDLNGDGSIANQTDLIYKSSDCSGTPHDSVQSFSYATNILIKRVVGEYYVFERGVTPFSDVFCSDLSGSDSICRSRVPCETLDTMQPLVPVSISLDDPVAMPLRYGPN